MAETAHRPRARNTSARALADTSAAANAPRWNSSEKAGAAMTINPRAAGSETKFTMRNE